MHIVVVFTLGYAGKESDNRSALPVWIWTGGLLGPGGGGVGGRQWRDLSIHSFAGTPYIVLLLVRSSPYDVARWLLARAVDPRRVLFRYPA